MGDSGSLEADQPPWRTALAVAKTEICVKDLYLMRTCLKRTSQDWTSETWRWAPLMVATFGKFDVLELHYREKYKKCMNFAIALMRKTETASNNNDFACLRDIVSLPTSLWGTLRAGFSFLVISCWKGGRSIPIHPLLLFRTEVAVLAVSTHSRIYRIWDFFQWVEEWDRWDSEKRHLLWVRQLEQYLCAIAKILATTDGAQNRNFNENNG